MNKEKLEYYSRVVFLIIGVGVIAYVAFTYLFSLILPFAISWGIAMITNSPASKINKRMKLSVKWLRLVLSLLFLLIGASIVVGIAVVAAREAWAFLSGVAENEDVFLIISKIMNPLSGIFGETEAGIEAEKHIGEAIKTLISSFLASIVAFASNFVASIPRVAIFSLMCLISLIYFSLDLERINGAVRSLIPPKALAFAGGLKKRFFIAGARYIKAYFIIMLIVFGFMLTGLLVLKVKYAILLALIFSVLDLLPLVGVGTFIVPWSIFEIVWGELWRGIGLIILLVVTELVRNLLEPRIVGRNLGIHPIVSLALIYASFSVFGVLGLFLVPLLTVIFNVAVNKNDAPKVE